MNDTEGKEKTLREYVSRIEKETRFLNFYNWIIFPIIYNCFGLSGDFIY